ncbi:MAG: hypothetical protein INH43_10895, partial [Acidobacteriaceae bacterium]|nr:hypothetical protein [Acidobacteriaceae bacterium]
MSALELLDQYLRQMEARLRLAAWTRGAAVAAAVALGATLALVLVANAFAFADTVMGAARFLLFVSLALALAFGIVIPLLRINRRRAATQAESKFPEFRERLLTFIERREKNDPFLELVAADALPVAQHASSAALVSTARLAVFSTVAVMGVGLLLWLIQGGPGFVGHGANLLWMGTPKGAGSFYELVVQPGNKSVRKRADVLVSAQTVGFAPSEVQLFARFGASAKWEQSAMLPRLQASGYEFLFAGLPDSVEYYVAAGPVKSPVYKLTALELPGVKRIRVTYQYPRSLGLPSVTEENGGDLRALIGTEANVEVEFDKPMAKGLLYVDAERQVPLTPGPGTWASAKVKIEKDGVYHVAALEPAEIVRLSDDYFIEARKDEEAILKIRKPGRDAKVSPLEEVPVEVEAADDFGLRELKLVYSVNGGAERTVNLLTQPNAKSVAGKAMLALEEFKLVPGDVVTLWAVARDATRTTQSDLYFLEAQPFEKEYSQSQQSGGGGGGEQEDNNVTKRQKEIIAATWNQLRNRFAEPKATAENARFLAETQAKLREQAKNLATRMNRRELSGSNEEFKKFEKDISAAVAAMGVAAEKLKAQGFKDALPHEQQALQHLMRADSVFKQIQVAMGQRGGGGGGGGGAARDLENLFDLELDTEKNQYETNQSQQSAEQRAREVDEAMQRLEQLARRQQELAQQQQQGKQNFQQKWQQEQLKREAEELKRQMEQLARGEQSPQQQQGQQG